MTYRPEFLEGLRLLADACEEMVALGYSRPVLVGGAAVELWTGSEVVSGDFDLVTQHHKILEEILLAKGFSRPGGVGMLLRGVLHPVLGIGVEVVGSTLFDGAVSADRTVLVSFDAKDLAVISVEDVIADRMGQYASHPPSNLEMLDQAIKLFLLAPNIDGDYLDQRIWIETAQSYGLSFLTSAVQSYEENRTTGNRGEH